MRTPPQSSTPSAYGPTSPASSAWEARLEDLVPAEVLAEVKAQVASRAASYQRTGVRPPTPPRWWVHRLEESDPVVTVELGDEHTEKIEALQAAMAALGVGDLAAPLTRVTLACAALTTPSRPTDPGDQATDPGSQATDPRSQATDPGSQATNPGSQGTGAGGQPGVLARSKELLGVVESVVTVSSQLDAVLVRAVRDLTAGRAQLLLGEKGVSDPGELTSSQAQKWARAARACLLMR